MHKFQQYTQFQSSRRQHCLLHCLSYPCIKPCNAIFSSFMFSYQIRNPVHLLESHPFFSFSIAGVPATFLFLCGNPRPYSFSIAGVPRPYSFSFQLRQSPPHLFFTCGSPRPGVALISIFIKI